MRNTNYGIAGNQFKYLWGNEYETNMLQHNSQENDNNFQQHVSSILPLKNKLL
jgi:hypothetical protein